MGEYRQRQFGAQEGRADERADFGVGVAAPAAGTTSERELLRRLDRRTAARVQVQINMAVRIEGANSKNCALLLVGLARSMEKLETQSESLVQPHEGPEA